MCSSSSSSTGYTVVRLLLRKCKWVALFVQSLRALGWLQHARTAAASGMPASPSAKEAGSGHQQAATLTFIAYCTF
jgi:hypothetical protein